MATAYRRRNPWLDYVPPTPAPPPELMPVFGAQVGWSPDRTCADVHPGGPIPSGSLCVCMVCSRSGVEHRTRDHTKPGDGQLREGWQTPEATVYAPPVAITPKGGVRRLRGGTGR